MARRAESEHRRAARRTGPSDERREWAGVDPMCRTLRLAASGEPVAIDDAPADAAAAFAAWIGASRASARAAAAARRLPAERADALLGAAVDAETEAERRLFAAPAETLAEFAAKVWVAAGQDFDAEDLNDRLRREAARILRGAGLLGPQAE